MLSSNNVPVLLLFLFVVILLVDTISDAFLIHTGRRIHFLKTRPNAAAQPEEIWGKEDGNDEQGMSWNNDRINMEFIQNPFQSSTSSFPSSRSSSSTPPSKSDLYSNEDLQTIFQLHQDLSSTFQKAQERNNALDNTSLSMHDLVLQFLDEQQRQQQQQKEENENEKKEHQLFQNIRAIASDVDGTLLDSNHKLHPRTESALYRIIQAVQDPKNTQLQYFFLATGKTRPGALHHLTPELQRMLQQAPGVYIQGLYCIGPSSTTTTNQQQQVVFERRLSMESVMAAEQFAQQHSLTLLGYQADQIFVTQFSHLHHIQEIHTKYGEPEPIVLDTFHGQEWNKLILMGDDNDMLQQFYRPLWDDLAQQYGATTTQAVPLMLELLPPGCNKGVGVRNLCHVLGIDPETELLAIGDGENDKEMLEMAACGIALGNAVAVTKDVADIVLTETNNDGGAGIALERFGKHIGIFVAEEE